MITTCSLIESARAQSRPAPAVVWPLVRLADWPFGRPPDARADWRAARLDLLERESFGQTLANLVCTLLPPLSFLTLSFFSPPLARPLWAPFRPQGTKVIKSGASVFVISARLLRLRH